ncbi:replication protein A 70 kDa DNA-binding subunit C-like [Brassica napus]|nr:replication protein A 70 kDa DNA-binding subunit C-like [Brassica napus]
MVLIDGNGDKIHATVKKELVNQFDIFLAEGKTKMMINLSLNHSCGSYRTTNHLYKISFLATTRVKICEDLPRAINGFQPVNYREILDGTLNSDHLVDVIGQVVEVSQVDVLSVNGKDTQNITLELRDLEDVRLPLVLWGSFASDVSNAMQTRRDEALIYDRSISNAYNVSDVSLNPYMTEVEEFKSK